MATLLLAPALKVSQRDTRIDLVALKSRLQRVLSEKAGSYWQVLRKFIQAKLTKHEFDEFARLSLGPEHLYLHNLFILSIISNAHCSSPPRALKGRSGTRGQHPLQVPLSVAKAPSKVAINVPATVRPRPRVGQLQRARSSSNLIRLQTSTQSSRPATTRLTEEELDLIGEPRLLALRRKMLQVAQSTGLAQVSNDSVRYMMVALEQQLKNVIRRCCPYIEHASVRRVGTSVVTASDLFVALEVNPGVLGEDPAINRERALLSLRAPVVVHTPANVPKP